jgi:hemoglobin
MPLREKVVPSPDLTQELSEALVEQLVQVFYARIREDAALGPIFESRLTGRWDTHLAAMTDFWSSVVLKSGRYRGQPHVAHQPLGLEPEHFARWLALFEATVADLCAGEAAATFVEKAHRIADSLQVGLNIGAKALCLHARCRS